MVLGSIHRWGFGGSGALNTECLPYQAKSRLTHSNSTKKSHSYRYLSDRSASLSATFDDENLVSAAGLVPALALAMKTGLGDPFHEHLSVPGYFGANAGLKVTALLAGIFARACARSTLGSLLRDFTFGHARQLDAAAWLRMGFVTATGLALLRANSALRGHAIVSAAHQAGAKVSITARMNPVVKRTIGTIAEVVKVWAAADISDSGPS